MLEILEACIKLGIPMAVLSWLMFTWLHSEGKLDIAADRKTIASNLKEMKKSRKSDRKARTEERKKKKRGTGIKHRIANLFQFNSLDQSSTNENAHFLFNRWMWFGSGFYGLAALWTLVIVEMLDVLRFIFAFPGFDVIFANGIIGAIVDFLLNQLSNFISAFLWFGYWGNGSVLTWILVAYAGYFIGTEIAKRGVASGN